MIDWLDNIDEQAVANVVLSWMGRAMFYGSLLAGLTWIITRLGRNRLSAGVHALLWSIVLWKFLAPVGPEWTFSFQSTLDRLATSTTVPFPANGTELDLIPLNADQAALAANGIRKASSAESLPWATMLTAVYVGIVVVLLVTRIRAYRNFRRRCSALPPADRATRELLHRVCRRLGVRCIPEVRISEDIPAPFVAGVIRPLLVLACRQLKRQDELETVIVHEVAHLRRGDMLMRMLQWTVGTLLFFWPVVAWVNRHIDAAREYACDEWALMQGKLTVGQYARCLLNAAQPMQSSLCGYRPACMAGNPKTIERRIDMILDSPKRASKRSLWSALTIALIIGWAGFALTGSTDVRAGQENEEAAPIRGVLVHEDGQEAPRKGVEYFLALAMESVDDFLDEYPHADLDEDGELTVEETLAFFKNEKMRIWTDTAVAIERQLVEKKMAEEEPVVGMLRRIREVPVDGELHRVWEAEPVRPIEKAFGKHRAEFKRHLFTSGVFRWLLDNKTDEPDVDTVAEYAAIVSDIQQTKFLERHPEADADGDGMLTVEERDDYRQSLRIFRENELKFEGDMRLEKLHKIEFLEKLLKIEREAAGRD